MMNVELLMAGEAYAIADTFSPKAGDTFFLLLCQQDADKFDPDVPTTIGLLLRPY